MVGDISSNDKMLFFQIQNNIFHYFFKNVYFFVHLIMELFSIFFCFCFFCVCVSVT